MNRPCIIIGIAANELEAIISEEEEMINMMSDQMAREIDQDIINDLTAILGRSNAK